MKVSIVIPVYNEERYIVPCLEHIFDQEEQADEVILVDNNCTDKTIALAKKFPVKIIHEPVQGMTPARNAGFDFATGAIIARTDADSTVPRDWIKRIKEKFADKETVAVTGPLHFYDVPEMFRAPKLPMFVYFRTFKRIFHHPCMVGPNMAIRRSVWLKVREMVCLDDEVVHEDVDLALHIAQFGVINFDYSFIVFVSPRRWKKLKPYFEYPYRYIRTMEQHHESILSFTRSRRLVKRLIQKTRRNIEVSPYSSVN
jgi:glycosyltransferase involved in cell wall biosynthesis